MVKTAKGVTDVSNLNIFVREDILTLRQFLDDLEQKLRPVGLKDREALLALKKKEHEALGIPFDGEFYIWDYRYYDRKYIEERLSLNDTLVREYFPVAAVVPAVLKIYQDLLSVRFVPVKGTKLWHPGYFII